MDRGIHSIRQNDIHTQSPTAGLANFVVKLSYVGSVVIFSFLLKGIIQSRGYDLLNLNLNLSACFSMAAIASNGILLIVLSRIRNKVPALLWFSLFLFDMFLWSIIEMMLRMSNQPSSAQFWIGIQNIGPAFVPPIFLMFTLIYTKNEKYANKTSVWASFFLTALVFFYVITTTNLTHSKDLSMLIHHWWGYSSIPMGYFPVFVIWVYLNFILSLALLIQFYHRYDNGLSRKQTRLFIIGVTFPILGSITDAFHALVPAISDLPPTAVVFTSLMAIVVGFAILRYGLFAFNPISLASNILLTMKEAVIVTDLRYKVQYMNQEAERLLKSQLTTSEGIILEDLTGSGFASTVSRVADTVLTHHQSYEIQESSIQTSHGDDIPVSLAIVYARNEKGEAAGYILVLTNLTPLKESNVRLLEKTKLLAEKQAELREEKANVERKVKERTLELSNVQAQLAASINSLTLGFVLFDSSGRSMVNNPAIHEIFTLPTRKHWTISEIADSLDEPSQLLKNFELSVRQNRRVSLPEINYGSRTLRAIIVPVASEHKKTADTLILFEDITESKVLERSKDEFFSIASHELRTPLAAIRGYASVIRENSKDEKLNQRVDVIADSAKRLIEMVNSFLKLSRLEQGGLSFDLIPTDPFMVALDVASELEPIAKEKGIILQVHKPRHPLPMTQADPSHLKEVFENILGNALKYSEQGNISVRFSVHEQGNVQISIQDTGTGIPVADQKLLFHKFQQAGDNILTRGAENGGSGLGLYITKLMVEAMGGEIWLEASKVGEGSTFCVRLEIAR